MNAQNAKSSDENRPVDKYAAVRDPGATPRRNLKRDNVAVVHSSDLDSEPNTEMYEAYEEDEVSSAPGGAAAPSETSEPRHYQEPGERKKKAQAREREDVRRMIP